MVEFVNDKVTSKYYLEEFNKKTGKKVKKVVKVGSKDYMDFLQHTQDPTQSNYVAGAQGFVSDDTPLGVIGSSKVFRIPRGPRSSRSQSIDYVFEDGVPRFKDFKPIEVDGFTVDKKETNDGDMLKIVLKSNEISIADITVSKHLRYLIRGIQEFNNEMLQESDNREDEEENEEEYEYENDEQVEDQKDETQEDFNDKNEIDESSSNTHRALDYLKKQQETNY